jgi:hypothetical protein
MHQNLRATSCVALGLMLSACASIPTSKMLAKLDTTATQLASTCPTPPPGETLVQLRQQIVTDVENRLSDVRARLTHDQLAFAALVKVVSDGVESRILGQGPEPSSVSSDDLKEVINNIHEILVKSRTPSIDPTAAGDPNLALFDDALGFYFTQLFQNNYVDRFGNKLTAPTVSMTISDSEIAGALSVLVDVIMDYVLRSPVWVDNTAKPTQYFPADYTNTASSAGGAASSALVPTAVAFNKQEISETHPPVNLGSASDGTTWKWAPLVKLDPPDAGACKMDKRKLEVVEYVAQLASQEASGITGLTLGNFGGWGFSAGVYGKFSVGDNKTLQVIVQTLLAKIAERIVAEEAYRAAYYVNDSGKTIGEVIDGVLKIKVPTPN